MPSDLKGSMAWEVPAYEASQLRRFLNRRLAKFTMIAFSALIILYHFVLPNASFSHRPSLHRAGQQHVLDAKQQLMSQPHVGKVHALFGDPNPTYERALRLHEIHAEKMGHPMFVLREKLLSGLWSKPAFILSTILQELSLPEDMRLKWLLWNDADIVIMNSQISLDAFIPPEMEFDYVNMLVTNDRHGLNNGVFLIRVNDWAVKLLSGVIAFHNFKPDVQLKYSEQSALEEMIEDAYWRKAVVRVPQYWFNAYPTSADKENFQAHEFRAGALQIHFAGNKDGKRPDRMNHWMDISEQQLQEWDVPVDQTFYADDIKNFWADLSEKRAAKGIEGGGTYKAEVNAKASSVNLSASKAEGEHDTAGIPAAQ